MNIQNTDLKTAIKDAISSNSFEGIPNLLLDKVAPVIDVNPSHNRQINRVMTLTLAISGSQAITTVEPLRDILIHAIEVAVVKDVTCDIANGFVSVSAVVNKLTSFLCSVPVITLTADVQSKLFSCPVPIKIDRNTVLTLTAGAHAAGNISKRATIHYSLIDSY